MRCRRNWFSRSDNPPELPEHWRSSGSDVAFEDARLSESAQAFANGAGTLFSHAFDAHEFFDGCCEHALQSAEMLDEAFHDWFG